MFFHSDKEIPFLGKKKAKNLKRTYWQTYLFFLYLKAQVQNGKRI